MSFYIYQSVEQLNLPNTSINLSATNHQPSAINYQSSAIKYKLTYQSTNIFTEQSLNILVFDHVKCAIYLWWVV
jgi:hypothetical protein